MEHIGYLILFFAVWLGMMFYFVRSSVREHKARAGVIDVVQELSAIAQENAASTEETSASVTEVSAISEEMSEEAKKLRDISNAMEERMSVFKI